MKYTLTQAKKISKKYGINDKVVPVKWFLKGLNVESEHGSNISEFVNISFDNPDITAKIVIAHLLEDPKYYQRLDKMEKQGEKYWKTHVKPSIFQTD